MGGWQYGQEDYDDRDDDRGDDRGDDIGMMTMALGRTKHWWEYMDVFGGQGIRVMVVIEKNGCWCLPIGVEGSSGECEGIESITIKIFADISGQATIGKELGDEKLTIASCSMPICP